MSSDNEQYPYLISGTVVRGFGRGSKKLGCPTANLESSVVDSIALPNGIYFGFAQLRSSPQPSSVYAMVCSLGYNPHFNNTKRSLEVHVLHQFGQDFYGAQLNVAICGYIRAEARFESLDQLKVAIASDIQVARTILEVEKKFEHVRNGPFFSNS